MERTPTSLRVSKENRICCRCTLFRRSQRSRSVAQLADCIAVRFPFVQSKLGYRIKERLRMVHVSTIAILLLAQSIACHGMAINSAEHPAKLERPSEPAPTERLDKCPRIPYVLQRIVVGARSALAVADVARGLSVQTHHRISL